MTNLDTNIALQDIRFSTGATATNFTLVDYTDFGAEVRSIASASIYGTFGAVGDGVGVKMYLISHNFAYIGNDYEVDNDAATVIQANEVVANNGAKIFYSSVDHRGDFRVGDANGERIAFDKSAGLLIMSSSEKILLKPFPFQAWPLFSMKGLRCPDSI